MRRGAAALAALTLALLGWGGWRAASIEPLAVAPAADPGLRGPYAVNDRLAAAERVFAAEAGRTGGVAVDPAGHLHVATADGRLLRLMADGTLKPSALTGAAPVALAMGRDRTAVVADPARGLVVARKEQQTVLAAEVDGRPLRFPAGVALGLRSGRILFSDASDRHGAGATWAEFVEMRGRGRLLMTDDLSREVRTLADGLRFPAGVALAADESFVLVCEATAFRVLRYWLAGERAGTQEVFVDGLPGYPFALAADSRGGYWLSLYAPRIEALERLAQQPWLRRLWFALPRALQPRPARHAIVLNLDAAGAVRQNLQHAAADAFAPVTALAEHDGWLYLSSLTQPGLARLRLPAP